MTSIRIQRFYRLFIALSLGCALECFAQCNMKLEKGIAASWAGWEAMLPSFSVAGEGVGVAFAKLEREVLLHSSSKEAGGFVHLYSTNAPRVISITVSNLDVTGIVSTMCTSAGLVPLYSGKHCLLLENQVAANYVGFTGKVTDSLDGSPIPGIEFDLAFELPAARDYHVAVGDNGEYVAVLPVVCDQPRAYFADGTIMRYEARSRANTLEVSATGYLEKQIRFETGDVFPYGINELDVKLDKATSQH